MLVVVVAFLAGIVSVLTPCVLPLLPALLTVSSSGGRTRAVGLVIGLITTFSIGLVVLTATLTAAGEIGQATRLVAVAVLVGIGVLFLVPALKDRVEAWTSRLVSGVRPGDRGGLGGGLLTGLALGVVWTPCAGPVLAAVAAAAAQQQVGARSLVTLTAFALGMAVPLTVLALGGRAAGTWLRVRVGGRRLDVATGVVLLVTALLVATGLDTGLNRWVAENTALGTTLTAGLEQQALDGSPSTPEKIGDEGYPELDELTDLGPAPAPVGLGPWFNTPGEQALTAEDLAGKVVLVDFWTYSCINCLRTLPYLRAWHDAYADDGLVVLGVHAPEFAFESDPDNVRRAIDDLDVTWPVALDNDYETWQAYANRYWPAKYLLDADGTVRYAHYGEGSYEQTEGHIRTLLGLDGGAATGEEDPPSTPGQTPETYLGYERGERFAGFVADDPSVPVVPDEPARYQGPENLDRNIWTLAGEWTVERERSVAGADAELWLHYYGRDVFLVMGETRSRAQPAVVVSTDDGPGGQTTEHVIDAQRLYVVRDTDKAVDGLIRLEVPPGVAVYAFTFG